MATLSRGQSFGATETVTNTKLHNLVDLATITNIVDADISASANIQFSKILASTLDASLLGNLANISAGAGKIPNANLNLPFGATQTTLCSIPNNSLLPLTLASWVDGAALRNLASTPVDQQIRYNLLVSSLASGGLPQYNGANNFNGYNPTPVIWTLVSTTNVSSATDSANITISAGSYYQVIFQLQAIGGSVNFALRFNADTGANYRIGAGAVTSIAIKSGVTVNTGITGRFNIYPCLTNTSNTVSTMGDVITDSSGSFASWGGTYQGGSAIASFLINGNNTYSGTIYLYKISVT